MWGNLRVRMTKNVKECVEALAWHLSETGTVVSYKHGTLDVCMVNKEHKYNSMCEMVTDEYHSMCKMVNSVYVAFDTQQRIFC